MANPHARDTIAAGDLVNHRSLPLTGGFMVIRIVGGIAHCVRTGVDPFEGEPGFRIPVEQLEKILPDRT